MKVIICGAGQVGKSIAKQLVLEGNDVTVIDQSEKLIEKINNTLDVTAFVGYASHPNVLEKAGIANADMIIAVTQSDEINMVACQVAHSIFNVPNKIARIRSQSYFIDGKERLFSPENMPIDVMISPEVEVANAIYEKLHVPGAIEAISFVDGNVKLISVKANNKSIINGLKIIETCDKFSGLKANIIGFVREQEFYARDSKLTIQENDEIYVVVQIDDLKEVMGLLGHEEKEAQRIVIVGGGRVGYFLARQLEKRDNIDSVKIIEHNEKRAEKISERLESTTVIHGDALDQEILQEVNIANSDAIIAVSNDDEVNILSSLLAKKSGCKAAVALINSISFAPLFSTLGIDAIVNPREITVSSILRYVKSFKVRNIHAICDSKVEIIETDAFESSYSIGKTIRDIKFPNGIYICMIIREDKYIIPDAETEIAANDRLIILTRIELIKKVEKLFSEKFKYF